MNTVILDKSQSSTRRNDLDILKAIAIISIVFYHFYDLHNQAKITANTLFSGGVLGVDIFFIISGYLIVGGLIKRESTIRGIVKFYKRRLLRIIPPLLGMCAVTLGLGYFLIFPSVYDELARETIQALNFSGNFRFARHGGYFSLDSADKLLLHTWYLCITIQFYLICPLIIHAIRKFFGKTEGSNAPRRALLIFTLLLLIPTLIFERNGNGYLLTQCRIIEPFLGGVLFLYQNDLCKILNTKKYGRFWLIVGYLIILTGIMCTTLKNGEWYFYNSISAIIGTFLVIIANVNLQYSILKPLVYLGKSSFSLYLWHWPIFVLALRLGLTKELSGTVIVFAVTFIISFISYISLEKKEYKPLIVFIAYLLILSSAYWIKNRGGDNYLVEHVETSLRGDIYLKDENKTDLGGVSVYKFGPKDATPHILMLGDSHAIQYLHYLVNLKDYSIYFLGVNATMAYGDIFAFQSDSKEDLVKSRKDFYEKYQHYLNNLAKGDKVILSNNWYLHYVVYTGNHNLEENDKSLEEYLGKLIEDLDSHIKEHPLLKFYIIGQGPNLSKDDEICSKMDVKDTFLKYIMSTRSCKIGRDSRQKQADKINEVLKHYALTHDNVYFIDRNKALLQGDNLYRLISDQNECGTKSHAIYMDHNHYSECGGKIVGAYVMKEVLKNN